MTGNTVACQSCGTSWFAPAGTTVTLCPFCTGDDPMTDRWEGIPGSTCEHASTGERAWCSACSEWCYPHAPCFRCCAPLLREVFDAAGVVALFNAPPEPRMERLRRALKAANDAGAEL